MIAAQLHRGQDGHWGGEPFYGCTIEFCLLEGAAWRYRQFG